MSLKLEAITSIGKGKSYSLHAPFEHEYDRYPPQEAPAREWRMQAGHTLGSAGRLLGVSVVVASALERGAWRPVDGWPALKALYDANPGSFDYLAGLP